jgi:hypothetical protein
MAELSEKQIKRLRALIDEAETNLAAAKELVISLAGDGGILTPPSAPTSPDGQVVEGVFDGQAMIGPDGRPYPISSNYASKSKLVEGDAMKLTITPDGKLLYKQIGPVERKNAIGNLIQKDGQYFVEVDGKEYRILLASVTYFRLHTGDKVAVTIPADDPDATWAAVESGVS